MTTTRSRIHRPANKDTPAKVPRAPKGDTRTKAAVDSGKRIKTLREALGLTQIQVGKPLARSGSTVAMWEAGKTAPDIGGWIKLALMLKTTPEYLAFGVIPEPKK